MGPGTQVDISDELRRSFGARLGVSLLNLLAPGAGLIRIGRERAGLVFALAMPVLFLLLAAAAALLPTLTPRGYLAVFVILILLALFVLIAPVVATWRHSRLRAAEYPRWRRWYALLALILVYQLSSNALLEVARSFYRPFYIPSEGMQPTFEVGDRLVADMRGGHAARPGDVILLDVDGAIYVKRVAAVGGDRIAMVEGVPVVNGVPALRRMIGARMQSTAFGAAQAELIAERLPGEQGQHRILETSPSPFDNMPEVTVPRDHLFVLGDNRDFSADSRVPREQHGVEMLHVSKVRGRPLFRTWTADWRWLGTPVR